MATLRLVRKGETDEVFPLDRDSTILGKEAGCDILLPDRRVSGRHARIERRPDGHFIEDLDSTNGTKVCGERLDAARPLEDGDDIEIIHYKLTFLQDDPPTEGTSTILATIDTLTPTWRPAAEERLRVMMEIGRELVGVLDPDAALEKALAAIFRIFPQAERGLALSRDDHSDSLLVRASKLRHPDAGAGPCPSRTIYEHVTVGGRAILCDVANDPRFQRSRSVEAARIRSMMCVPLWGHGHLPVGVLQVDTRDDRRFHQDDLDLLVAIAGTVSLAVENARLHGVEVRHKKMEQEGEDARAVQRLLLPERCPNLTGYEFWHEYEPALSVGGDYFDYRPVPDIGGRSTAAAGRWAVALGDVTGKGMPAALMMARLSSEVRLLLQAEPDPARAVERLNRGLCESAVAGKFVTFLLILIDGNRHEMTVVNAGHMGPIVRRADGRVEVVGEDRSGLLLGVEEEEVYRPTTIPIGPGDVVVLYTDGVSEAMDVDGRLFGTQRLLETLAAAPPGAGPVGEAILGAVRRHAAGRDQFDDITLLSFGRA
jgi:sigma-B regulation protein RsbU (phosphoserine phosphatase)